MFKQIIFFMIVATIVSCGEELPQQNNTATKDTTKTISDSAEITNQAKNNLTIQANKFIQIDTSAILMFPLSISKDDRNGGSLTFKETPDNSSWNIIFLNTNTNKYHLLSENKLLIKNYSLEFVNKDLVNTPATKRHIFFSVITNDYNKDGKLTNDDPVYLFVTDKEGNYFNQISPANCTVESWQYLRSENKVLMTVKKDSDNDNKFDDKDETTIFQIDLDDGKPPEEEFSADFKNKLKVLYDRDWKTKK